MPIILDLKQKAKLEGRKRRPKRMKSLKSPVSPERSLYRRMVQLWSRVLNPATAKIEELVKAGASYSEIAEIIELALDQAEFEYGFAIEDFLTEWKLSVSSKTRRTIEQGLGNSLGIDLTVLYDTPAIQDVLAWSGMEAAGLIKSIPGQYLSQVAQAVNDNFTGKGLPEQRSLSQQLRHIGKVSKGRARVIARDQTSKLTATLNRFRQEDIGVTEYIWRTVKDNRVVGKPGGRFPEGNKAHGNHYDREGKKFSWNNPPEDGHPGMAIQCRCWAEPVIDIEKILQYVEEG